MARIDEDGVVYVGLHELLCMTMAQISAVHDTDHPDKEFAVTLGPDEKGRLGLTITQDTGDPENPAVWNLNFDDQQEEGEE